MKILEELDRLSEEATDGPWSWRRFGDRWHLVADHGRRDILLSNARSRNSAGLLEEAHPNMPNMELIPAIRNNLDALMEAARCLQYAVAFGQFTPGGSTENWAKEILEKLE